MNRTKRGGRQGMTFEKIKSTILVAKGKKGFFILKKRNGLWWGEYSGSNNHFYLPPRKLISEAKALCQENDYWED